MTSHEERKREMYQLYVCVCVALLDLVAGRGARRAHARERCMNNNKTRTTTASRTHRRTYACL